MIGNDSTYKMLCATFYSFVPYEDIFVLYFPETFLSFKLFMAFKQNF